jgi:hypothetical protein
MCRKKIMATFRSAEWFEAMRGLRNQGADVLRLSKRDVSKEELAQASGPKSSKNGWRMITVPPHTRSG